MNHTHISIIEALVGVLATVAALFAVEPVVLGCSLGAVLIALLVGMYYKRKAAALEAENEQLTKEVIQVRSLLARDHSGVLFEPNQGRTARRAA